jgi:hypothetical protein
MVDGTQENQTNFLQFSLPVAVVRLLPWGDRIPSGEMTPGWPNCAHLPPARQFRFASSRDVSMVSPSTKWGVRRGGLRLEDVRLLYPPNLTRVMPP